MTLSAAPSLMEGFVACYSKLNFCQRFFAIGLKHMHIRAFQYLQLVLLAIPLITGCSSSQKVSDAQLQTLGVRVGAAYWDATGALRQAGYVCDVSGAKREFFECTKSEGVFPSCILRVRFSVDDQNKITMVAVPEPACMGTP